MLNMTTVFTRLGAIAALPKDLLSFQLGTWTTDVNNITVQYPVGDQAGSAYAQQVTALIAAISSNFSSVLQATAQQTIQEMVQADSPPGFNANIVPPITPAVFELIRQMRIGGFTIKKCKVTSSALTVPNVTNTGNGVVVLSNKRVDGLDQENQFAETTLMTCTNDAQQGNTATAGNENWSWTGLGAAPSFFDPTWPLGSGKNSSFQTISALYNNSNGNVLNNGNFESFTGGLPSNFSVLLGAAQLKQSTAQFFTGKSSLQLVGDGATKVAFAQTFASSSGTTFAIPVQSQFAVNGWLFMDSVPALGTLELALVDQNGNITTDSYGNQNVCTFDLPTIARSEPLLSSSQSASSKSSSSSSATPFPAIDWEPINCVFRSGEVLPTQYLLRFRLTTPLSAGTNLFFDQFAMGQMTQLYTGGSSISVFDGSTHFVSGGPFALAAGPPDQFELVFTNDRGGAANLATFQTALYRLLTIGADVLFPSAANNNISDTLIVG